ncbi:family 65 glycosyl hydrolase [Clostridium estertheticum]|uniref:glycoside hydrolase family 65 protein n=1 Tax=Clostridium estertheticum TaxID=238834 RepID=UPI0013E99E3E|nr:glycoside hydrolase family 65 protein [Clostridium estertheticum]MBZ9688597.1 family 65 glycosyl hydrolase [Clostridium estertheticum]
MRNGWIISDNSLNKEDLLKNESIFNVSNGYIGIRGNFEEKYPDNYQTIRGSYINAFYEEVPIQYGEKAYAFPETMQKIVNITDAQNVNIIINGERFSLFEGTVKSLSRYLDMKAGCYVREIWWVSPRGLELKIKITRLASLKYLELFAINYEIEKVNFDEGIIIESGIDGDVTNFTDESDPRLGAGHANILSVVSMVGESDIMQVVAETENSNKFVAVTTKHSCNVNYEVSLEKAGKVAKTIFKTEPGSEIINFTKYNVYTDSRRYKNLVSQGIDIAEKISGEPFKQLLDAQRDYLNEFWGLADINIEGDEKLKLGLRYNLFQLLQSVGKDSKSNITAKGLSGEGYEGHYFWDTEIYILPFFTLCQPELAKGLLKYRYTILDKARKRARELGHKKGAAYPWRTIIGEECSAYFPGGTAQYHINADIAYSYIQYYLATGDINFIKECGAEVVFETARIWIQIGHFHKGQFKIDAVTGPDEYTAIVNNNYYTNVMAKYNLKWASKLYYELLEKDNEVLKNLCNKISLTEEEIEQFARAYKNMCLPYNDELKINAQDDSFLSKAVWDFENTPKEKYPLLLNFHPLTIYRYQVLKQADTVLAHFLVEDESDTQTIKNSYDYYERITTHDSSLSCAAYSIMASKIGYSEKAYEYFIETARLDLDDTHGNTKDGIHTANMGGTWMAIVYGFAGLRIKENYISLTPKLPEKWKQLKFKLLYKGANIQVDIKVDKTEINLQCDCPINVKVNNILYEFIKSGKIEISN